MDNVSLVLKNFNDKIRLMNQTGSKTLIMTADDARNLHNEIFILLAKVSSGGLPELKIPVITDELSISMDGGGFK
jgi:hypothetical protein